MATQIQDIHTPNWQGSSTELGEVLLDEEDIEQCVYNIIFTRKGDVPFNSDFGTNVHLYIDEPQFKAGAKIVSDVTQGIITYEKRLSVDSVSVIYSTDARIEVTVAATVVASANKVTFKFDLSKIKTIQ